MKIRFCQVCPLHFGDKTREAIVCHQDPLSGRWFGLCDFHQAQRVMLEDGKEVPRSV